MPIPFSFLFVGISPVISIGNVPSTFSIKPPGSPDEVGSDVSIAGPVSVSAEDGDVGEDIALSSVGASSTDGCMADSN